MAITDAAWCDFVVYTLKGMSILIIKFDQQFWDNMNDRLKTYYFKHFISFAVSEYKCKQNDARLTRSSLLTSGLITLSKDDLIYNTYDFLTFMQYVTRICLQLGYIIVLCIPKI